MIAKSNIFHLIVLLLTIFVSSAAANEPTLIIDGNTSKVYSRSELLKHPDLAEVLIVGDVAYKRDMHYWAVPIAALLEPSHPDTDNVIQFVATDGFVAELPIAPLLNRDPTKAAVAYLAVEPTNHAWPQLKLDEEFSAGPFYLVWLNPQRSHIGPEQWPYQIAKIAIVSSLRKRWPALAPSSDVAADSPVNRGFAVYQKNCFACHRLNRSGEASKGPDLNLPMNPTEYFQASALRKLIRNPASVRSWSGQSMPAFNEKILSNRELEDLLAYLKHMARHKVDAP